MNDNVPVWNFRISLGLTLLLGLLIVTKLACQIATAMSCELVELDLKDTATIRATMGINFKGNGIECAIEGYETDDPFIRAARGMLSLSVIFGGAAGIVVAFEWLVFEVCCAGLLEGSAYLMAWVMSGCTFIFYGASVCNEDKYHEVLADNNLMDLYAGYLSEGGADFLKLDGEYEGCERLSSSHFMTVAIICYFLCGACLCW